MVSSSMPASQGFTFVPRASTALVWAPSELPLRMHPRLAILPRQQLVGFRIADDFVLCRIPNKGPAELHRQVGEDATGGRDVALLDVGDGPAAAGDGAEEVAL